MLDIYYKEDYGRLCKYIENGELIEFSFSSEFGEIKDFFIKRPIPQLINNTKYYDLITPYGYGGPIILRSINKEKLLLSFNKKLEEYCFNNNIVSEFVRFHPIFENYKDFCDIYDSVFLRKTIGTNLTVDDPISYDFSKSMRRDLRKAIESGIECKIIEKPKNLITFRKLYEETMNRNHADEKYYFPDQYYEILCNELSDDILEIQAIYNGKIIASEIYFIAGDIMHAHLLGSDELLFKLNGGALLEATAARWGKEHNYRFIHHGGGRTSAPDDNLYLYKKKFGKNTEFEFWIGKKIWNSDVYNKLCELSCNVDENYFPRYR